MCLFWGFVKIQKAELHKNLYDFGSPGQKTQGYPQECHFTN